MAHVPPLRREDLPEYEEVFAGFERQLGFVPSALLVLARRPGILEGLRQLLAAVWGTGTVDPALKSLVAVMASYGAGCRYCQAHAATRSVRSGVTEEKLAALGEFDHDDRFSEAERAALRLALASGQVPNAVTAGHFEDLRRHFDDGEITEIVAVASTFGFLNRWNETMATGLEEVPSRVAAQHLGPLNRRQLTRADPAVTGYGGGGGKRRGDRGQVARSAVGPP